MYFFSLFVSLQLFEMYTIQACFLHHKASTYISSKLATMPISYHLIINYLLKQEDRYPFIFLNHGSNIKTKYRYSISLNLNINTDKINKEIIYMNKKSLLKTMQTFAIHSSQSIIQ